jgi:hypothetical protein
MNQKPGIRERLAAFSVITFFLTFGAAALLPVPMVTAQTTVKAPTTTERLSALEAAVKTLQATLEKLTAPPPKPAPSPSPTAKPSPNPTHSSIPTTSPAPVTVPVAVSVPTPTLTVTPTPGISGSFKITKITPNQTSCIVEFTAVAGAKDYRVYEPAHNGAHGGKPMAKYSGGGLRIEINGLDPTKALQGDYIVEAVDALGPYQIITGDTPHSEMTSINGQGPSTNVPKVLAVSAPFKPVVARQPWPTQSGGRSLFRDTFEDTRPEATTFTRVATPTLPAALEPHSEFYGKNINHAMHTRYQSLNWRIDFLGHEPGSESIFIHQQHLMELFLDGGARNNNASSVLYPLVDGKPLEFDLADGKIVHLTYEVDPYMGGRRWVELQLFPAGEALLNPGKFQELRFPTESGRLIRWSTGKEWHQLDIFQGAATPLLNKAIQQIPVGHGDPNSLRDNHPELAISRLRPEMNGTTASIDIRNRFDLYISRDRYAIYENGVLAIARPWTVPLPFTQDERRVRASGVPHDQRDPERLRGEPLLHRSDQRQGRATLE